MAFDTNKAKNCQEATKVNFQKSLDEAKRSDNAEGVVLSGNAVSNFYTWLRSGLRKLSRRWPPVFEALADAKVAYVGENKRRKYSYVCAHCGYLFDAKSVAVDHKEPAGQLNRKEDIADFVTKLFCDKTGLQVLCHTCHDIKSYMEKHDCTKEEAILAKDVIAFMKKPKQEILAFLQEHGYTGAVVSNETKRRALLEQILKERLNG